MKEYSGHYSVLKKECLSWLLENNNNENSTFSIVDLTFGGGGHTFAMEQTNKNVHVISTDQDPEAYQNGLDLIQKNKLEDKIRLFKSNFVNFDEIYNNSLKEEYPEGFNGFLLDLGVSSHHFDSGERGFSFNKDGPLDMRMASDNNEIETAADIINNYTEEEIANILFEYGEEKFSRRIAKNIIERRSEKLFERTKDLEEIIFHAYPSKFRYGRTHPATKTFQALRIKVNEELSVISQVLPKISELLLPGGRIAVISFHSLEDRIVKHAFKKMAPLGKNLNQSFKILTKKPIIPGEEEIKENPRSRSAKLRVLEKL